MNQFEPEDRLSKALRNLAQESACNAPPELGMELAGAFRRHHRRRRAKNAVIVVLATVCLLSTTWLLTRPSQKPTPSQIVHGNSHKAAPGQVVATTSNGSEIKSGAKEAIKQGPKRRTSRPEEPQVASRETGDFLPLPSYDPSVAANSDLQIIRVEMPIQDLRLVGAPVNVNIPNRPVLADFVVGRDGTPYAVRLVR